MYADGTERMSASSGPETTFNFTANLIAPAMPVGAARQKMVNRNYSLLSRVPSAPTLPQSTVAIPNKITLARVSVMMEDFSVGQSVQEVSGFKR